MIKFPETLSTLQESEFGSQQTTTSLPTNIVRNPKDFISAFLSLPLGPDSGIDLDFETTASVRPEDGAVEGELRSKVSILEFHLK